MLFYAEDIPVLPLDSIINKILYDMVMSTSFTNKIFIFKNMI
jgi:hypothetical protein